MGMRWNGYEWNATLRWRRRDMIHKRVAEKSRKQEKQGLGHVGSSTYSVLDPTRVATRVQATRLQERERELAMAEAARRGAVVVITCSKE
jgi:hypothetical protein